MAERDRALAGVAGTWPPRGAMRAGGIAPSGFSAWSSILEKVREWIRAEAGPGRLLPWVPVAFGTGIAFYFTADHEPVLGVAVAAAAALCAAAFLLRRGRIFSVVVMIAAAVPGFGTDTGETAGVPHAAAAPPKCSVSPLWLC